MRFREQALPSQPQIITLVKGGDMSPLPSQAACCRGREQLRAHLGSDESRVFSTPSGPQSVLKVTVSKEGILSNIVLVCLLVKEI